MNTILGQRGGNRKAYSSATPCHKRGFMSDSIPLVKTTYQRLKNFKLNKDTEPLIYFN